MTKVVHCKKEDYDVYIGRGKCPKTGEYSKWGNPFVIGKDGTREEVIEKYEIYLNSDPTLAYPKELNGKTLGCWCAPQKCHGDILTKLARNRWVTNWFSNMLPLDEPFVYQGITYWASENFYQAMKLPKDRTDLRSEIAYMYPHTAKVAIKNEDRYKWREDWNKEESLRVMEYILRIKFKGKNWRRKLLFSIFCGNITEWNNWGDTFWGKRIDRENAPGENNLGKILMNIRSEILAEILSIPLSTGYTMGCGNIFITENIE